MNSILTNGAGTYTIDYYALNGAGEYAYQTYLNGATATSNSLQAFIASLSNTDLSADTVLSSTLLSVNNPTTISSQASDTSLMTSGVYDAANFNPITDFIASSDPNSNKFTAISSPTVSGTSVIYTATNSTSTTQKVTVQVLDSKGNPVTPNADGSYTLLPQNYKVEYSVIDSLSDTLSSTTDLKIWYFTLPFTGGIGLGIIVAVFAGIVGLALLLWKRRKKDEAEA